MRGYPSAYICFTALILAIIGQTFVELKLPALQQLYTALSFGTLICWIIFGSALSFWVRSDWLSKKLSQLNQDLAKPPKYKDPTAKK